MLYKIINKIFVFLYKHACDLIVLLEVSNY